MCAKIAVLACALVILIQGINHFRIRKYYLLYEIKYEKTREKRAEIFIASHANFYRKSNEKFEELKEKNKDKKLLYQGAFVLSISDLIAFNQGKKTLLEIHEDREVYIGF